MSEETSDDDEDAYSDVTFNSSTSASTTHNPTGEDSRNSSLPPPVPGSNQFVSSSLSPRYTGHPEPHDGMPVDGYQRQQDSRGM